MAWHLIPFSQQLLFQDVLGSPMRYLFALVLLILSPFHPFTLDLTAQTTGKEFWITIPPNEIPPFPTTQLEIYVSSMFDTEIEVFDAASTHTYKRRVKAGEVRTLSDSRGETNWTWEIHEFEEVVRKGIRIRSTQPIAVHVLNSKPTTSDGCLIFPTDSWDRQYIVTSYYDFQEFSPWAGGFCIVAKEPTTVKIALKGTGGNDAKTSGGKSLYGDTIRVTMDAGDVYAVKGDGTTRGIFDLTGTSITADKPIGVWGFHERTTMPNLLVNGNGRNHLVEMLPPVKHWGKRYVTTEFSRSGTNPQGRGDVFRIVASQPNTRWRLKFYDKTTKALQGQGGGILAKAGDFADLSQSMSPTVLTYGYSVWEADKPILVMQYATSANFDGDTYHDPFMICVVPEEQFLSTALWQTPTSTKFSTHSMNLIVYADTSDPEYIDNLKSIELDETPLWRHPQSATPTLLFNHMGNNLHWAQVKFGPTANSHRLRSNGKVRFGGYVYGYGAVDAYGWMMASAARPSSPLDTLPPVLSVASDCGDATYEATELRNIPDPPMATPRDSDQVESGIAEIDTVFGANSYNYMLRLVTDTVLPKAPSYKRFTFRWDVIDRSRDAYCVFYVKDWYGNMAYDTVTYTANQLELSSDTMAFGEQLPGSKDTMEVRILNPELVPIRLLETKLAINSYYRIIAGAIPPDIELAPNATHTIKVEYDAQRETNNVEEDFDLDTLIIRTTCGDYRLFVSGVASQAVIDVENYSAGYVAPGELTCKSGGLRISNLGSDTLVVTGFSGFTNSNFSVSPAALTALPYVILPQQFYMMRDVCYLRTDQGKDSIVVTFASNAATRKPTSTWTARTTITSVEDNENLLASISITHGTVFATWQGASVSRIVIHDVTGQSIAIADVASGAERVSVDLPSLAHQQVFVSLLDMNGTVLHHSVLVVP